MHGRVRAHWLAAPAVYTTGLFVSLAHLTSLPCIAVLLLQCNSDTLSSGRRLVRLVQWRPELS